MSTRKLKKSDKKSGRKRPRANNVDITVTPSPDSTLEQNKTPKSKKKLRFNTSEYGSSEKKLPVKKRKSLKPVLKRSEETSMDTTETRWIGRLTNKHKFTISNDQPICSDIMNEVQRILAAQYPDVNGLQQTEKTPVWDEAENKWKYARKFTNERSPSVQIHHTGNFHWVTSVKLDGEIYVLDSLSKGKLTASLQIQLASIYGSDYKKLHVKIPHIQQQTNSVDCGIFAIANAVQFCLSYYHGNDLIQYDIPFMRDHLLHCIEHERFSPFPRIQTKAKLNKRKPIYIEIPCDCKCHLPNLMEEMVGCDAMQQQCSAWRHRSCACADAEDDWLCTPHRNK